jgi:hypothetical protein
MFESTEIIGYNQYERALSLMNDESGLSEVTGPIDFRHSFVTMPELNVTLSDGTVKKLCSAAMV